MHGHTQTRSEKYAHAGESNAGHKHGRLVCCRYTTCASAQSTSWTGFCFVPDHAALLTPHITLTNQDMPHGHDCVDPGLVVVEKNRGHHEARRACGAHCCCRIRPAKHCTPNQRTNGRPHLHKHEPYTHVYIQMCLCVVSTTNVSPFLPYLSLCTPARLHPSQSKHVPWTKPLLLVRAPPLTPRPDIYSSTPCPPAPASSERNLCSLTYMLTAARPRIKGPWDRGPVNAAGNGCCDKPLRKATCAVQNTQSPVKNTDPAAAHHSIIT